MCILESIMGGGIQSSQRRTAWQVPGAEKGLGPMDMVERSEMRSEKQQATDHVENWNP